MSNVVAFKRRVPAHPGSSPGAGDGIVPFAAHDGTFCATLLLEGLDDPARALDKAAGIVGAMAPGKARDMAKAELERLSAHLAIA